MIELVDLIQWVLYGLVVIVGFFIQKTLNKIERDGEKKEERINALERTVAVIEKTVDNNFSTLANSMEALRSDLVEIKALLIEEIKKSKNENN